MSTYDVDILRRIEDKVLNDESLARGANVMGKLSGSDSEIRMFLKDRYVFITGSTGLLGHILLEKLLRTCPELRGIYILIRKKKGASVEERIDKMFENVFFSELKKTQRNFRKKVLPVEGDVEMLGLGLSEEDLKKIHEDVSIVFHMAATVRFDEQLKKAIQVNLRGTSELLQIVRQCSQLASIVYCSTAYSQCDKYIKLEEKYYDAPCDPMEVIKLVEDTDEADLIKMTPKILGNFPNTYAFSKACAEDLVRREAETLPICLFRPSVVSPTYREPLGGWTNNLYGPSGIILGTGVGIMHVMHADPNATIDTIPADLAMNAAIACAWKTGVDGVTPKTPPVYNYVSSKQNPLTMGELMAKCESSGLNIPTMAAVWYYSFALVNNWYLYAFWSVLMHFIPGLFVDAALFLMGKKPMVTKLYKTIWNYNKLLHPFNGRSWNFDDANMMALWARLNDVDQEMFNFNMGAFEWDRYFDIMVMGLRVYFLKDPASTLPQARIRWRRFYYAHKTIQVLATGLACWLIYYFVLPMLNYIF